MVNIKIEDITKIERVVATFEVSSHTFPHGKAFFRIIAVGTTTYFAMPNVVARSLKDGTPDWIGGLGNSIEAALADGIQRLLQTIEQHQARKDTDFVWSEVSDF